MKMLIKVNQTEALRRGINAPASTASLEVDPAQLTQTERDWIASNLKDGGDLTGHWQIPSAISPTVDGLREMIAERLARDAAEKLAKEQADREKAVTKLAKEQAFYAAVQANPLLALHMDNKTITPEMTEAEMIDYLSSGHHKTISVVGTYQEYHCHRGEEQLVRADAELWNQVTSAADRIRAAAKARREAKARAEYQAQLDRLQPYLDAEESLMLQRGYLDLAEVETRLTDAALDSLREKISPPDYELEITACEQQDRKPSSREEFRLLRRIESLLNQTARLITTGSGDNDFAVEINITTADGRPLRVLIKQPEAEA